MHILFLAIAIVLLLAKPFLCKVRANLRFAKGALCKKEERGQGFAQNRKDKKLLRSMYIRIPLDAKLLHQR